MAVEKDKSMSMSELQDLIVYYKDNLTEEYIQIDIMFAKKTASTKRCIKHGCYCAVTRISKRCWRRH